MVERADTGTDTIRRAATSASGTSTAASTDPRNYAYRFSTYITRRRSIAVDPLKYRVAGVEHSETHYGIHNTLYTNCRECVRIRKTPASSNSGPATCTTTTDTDLSYASRSNSGYNI